MDQPPRSDKKLGCCAYRGAEPCGAQKEDVDYIDERSFSDEQSVSVNLDQDNFIPVSVMGLSVTALIDTGAQVNTISTALLTKLQARGKIRILQSEYPAVVLADGAKRAQVSGKVYLSVAIDNSRFRVKLYVVESRQILIVLGNSFLRQHQAILNMARNMVFLKPYSKLYAARRTVIPLRTEVVMPCFVDGPFMDNTVGRIEPLPHDSSLQQKGIVTLESVSKVSGEITYVGLVNDTDARVLLKKGTKVAVFSCLPPGAVVRSYGVGKPIPKLSSYSQPESCNSQIISDEEFLSKFDMTAPH